MQLNTCTKLKYQLYIQKQLIENQAEITRLFEEEQGDPVYTQAFIEYMNDYNFESAFELCTRAFGVHNKAVFMQNLLACFYPGVIRDWNKYFILVQTETEDDFSSFDKCFSNECKAFDRIYLHIYN